MSWVKAIVSFIHARRHPHEIAREVEAELRFHIAMRVRANIEDGMKPDEAQLAALKSFGDFDRIKVRCCEISRSLPFDSRSLRMGLHITIAGLAGGVALWAVNVPHHNFTGVWRQLVVIAILARLFVVVRRAGSTEQFRKNKVLVPVGEARRVSIAAHDEQGRTPVERVFTSE